MNPPNPASLHEGRAQLRIPVVLESAISVVRSGRRKVALTDLSTAGCKVDAPYGWKEGQHVTITLPTLAPIGATVRWSTAEAMGLAFDRAIHTSVIQHIIDSSRPARL